MPPTSPETLLPSVPPSDLDRIVGLVLGSVQSAHSRRAYGRALADFLGWFASSGAGEGFTRATVQEYARHLGAQGLSASTVNVRLTAVRRLAAEATDNGLLDPALAAGIGRIRGARQHGTRTGNWLTADQAERLLAAPDPATLKGKRDRALLAVLVGCGLRRSEVSDLTFDHIQQRDGRWAIVDLHGKGNRVRTVPMPSWAKAAIDGWAGAAGLAAGHVFRSMNNRKQVVGERLLPQNVMEAVARYGRQIGLQIAPHDLRRTFAKLATRAGPRSSRSSFR
jgi:integrase